MAVFSCFHFPTFFCLRAYRLLYNHSRSHYAYAILIYLAFWSSSWAQYCVIVMTWRAEVNGLYRYVFIVVENGRHLLPVRFWFRYFNVHLLIFNISLFSWISQYIVNRYLYFCLHIKPRLKGWLQTWPATVALSSLTDSTLSHKSSPLILYLIKIVIICIRLF